MDIKGHLIEDLGGLHVVLTFLPANQRVEAQALGRTARQGAFGTAEYILRAGKYSAETYANHRALRDTAEDDGLRILREELYPATQIRDRAFEEYRSTYTWLRKQLMDKPQESVVVLAKAKAVYAVYGRIRPNSAVCLSGILGSTFGQS